MKDGKVIVYIKVKLLGIAQEWKLNKIDKWSSMP